MVKYRRRQSPAAIFLLGRSMLRLYDRMFMATESKKTPSGKHIRLTSLSKCAG
jgi:hypothetical protein